MHRKIALSVLLLIIGFLYLAQAQVPMTGAGKGAPGGGFVSTCTASSNWLARATNVTVTADKTNYDNLLCGLTSDGIIAAGGTSTIIDALYVHTAPDVTTNTLNLIGATNTFTLTKVGAGSITFSAYHGVTGDGSTTIYDTTFVPSSAGGNFALSSAHMGTYVLTNRVVANTSCTLGLNFNGGGGGAIGYVCPLWTGNTIQWCVECTSGLTPANVAVTAKGAYVGVRSAGSQSDLYINSSSTSISTSAAAGTSNFSNCGISLLGLRNNSGNCTGLTNFSADQFAAHWFGAGITGAQAAAIMGRVNTYMTAYGINAY